VTPKQIQLVQQTWARVLPLKEHAAVLFYDRLFATDPALQSLFKGNMAEQRGKLMTMITVAVNGLTRLDTLVPAVRDLGNRHARYGVQEAHYATVGAALLWTLEKGLGPAFTPEVKEAWATVYGVLATTMQQGAAAAAA
jgi:hemoglobin-like flavoprotein